MTGGNIIPYKHYKMDSKLFKEEYLPLHNELYSQAIKMLGNREEAEDAVQSLYLKLWERRNELRNIKDKRLIAKPFSPIYATTAGGNYPNSIPRCRTKIFPMNRTTYMRPPTLRLSQDCT